MTVEGGIPSAGYPLDDAAGSLAAMPLGASDGPSRILGQRQRLVHLIQQHGAAREDRRVEEVQAFNPSSATSSSARFSADLVYQEENGFELWLGSLEDALSLEALKQRDITGLLNCALEECCRECAPFRSHTTPDNQLCRRRRTHARGSSLAHDGEAAESRRKLPADVLRGLVEFNSFWYSEMCDCDMAYLGLEALDEDGYRMDKHFEEVHIFLDECRNEGRKVLVHCVMGINRSSSTLVSFLCGGLGMDLDEAVALAARHRGYILSNNSFLDQLIERYLRPDQIKVSSEISI